MVSRTPNQQKQADSRALGLMKKGDALYRKYGVRVAIAIDDNVKKSSYRCDNGWQAYFVAPDERRYSPGDFITLSEYQKGNEILSDVSLELAPLPPSTFPPHPVNDLEDGDFALLQAFNSEYPPLDLSETAAISEPAHSTEHVRGPNSKRPLPNTPDTSAKKARKEIWSSSSKPVTRSAKNVQHDPYNFAG